MVSLTWGYSNTSSATNQPKTTEAVTSVKRGARNGTANLLTSTIIDCTGVIGYRKYSREEGNVSQIIWEIQPLRQW